MLGCSHSSSSWSPTSLQESNFERGAGERASAAQAHATASEQSSRDGSGERRYACVLASRPPACGAGKLPRRAWQRERARRRRWRAHIAAASEYSKRPASVAASIQRRPASALTAERVHSGDAGELTR
jgi:hypothetical protein